MKVGDLIRCKHSTDWAETYGFPPPDDLFLIVEIVIEEPVKLNGWERPLKEEDRLYFYTIVKPDGTITKWNSRHTNAYYEVVA